MLTWSMNISPLYTLWNAGSHLSADTAIEIHHAQNPGNNQVETSQPHPSGSLFHAVDRATGPPD
jgi:hypothetical protein